MRAFLFSFTVEFFGCPQVEISFYLLRRLLGVKTQEGGKQAKVQKLQRQEILMVNIGSTASGGKVLAVKQVRGQFVRAFNPYKPRASGIS